MKKLLAILLALTLVLSMTTVFAETYDSFVNLSADTTEGKIPSYENGVEHTRHFLDDKNCVWSVSGDTVKNVSAANSTQVGVGSANTRIGVYKLPIPKIAGNQQFSKLEFNFSALSTQGATYYVLKMPGDDWTEKTIVRSNPTMTEIFADVTSNNVNNEKLKYNALSVGGKIDASDFATGFPYDSFLRYVADITDYANECYKNGQNAIWVAVGSTSTKNIAANTYNGYTTNPSRPYLACSISFTTGETGPLEFVSADVEDGAIVSGNTATYTFTNKLVSATAILNGKNVECEVKGTRAFIPLNAPGVNALSVTATDAAGNSITTEELKFRAGYNSQYLDDDAGNASMSHMVDNTGVTLSKYSPRVNNSISTVLKIKLPTLEEGKTFGHFAIRYISAAVNHPYIRLFKIPHDGTGYPNNLIQTSGEVAEGMINIYNYKQGSNGEYKADIGTKVIEGQNASGDAYAYADLTTYAKECIERGQTHMLIGFTASDARSIVGIGDGDLDKALRYHYIYWTTEDADLTAKAPKFVASSDANTFAAATGLSSIAKAGEYKFIASLANFGDADASVTLYIAQYANGELLSVVPQTVTVPANGAAADYTSANLTIDADAANVKAFIWNDAEQKPMLIGDVIIEAK